jgi:hypothetical protein
MGLVLPEWVRVLCVPIASFALMYLLRAARAGAQPHCEFFEDEHGVQSDR